jgi:hypothetical protein
LCKTFLKYVEFDHHVRHDQIVIPRLFADLLQPFAHLLFVLIKLG